ncbi:PAS domain S-box protein [Chloroflexota bacterium]
MATKIKDKSAAIIPLFAIGIILVILISIAAEYFAIPSLIFNTPPTPFSWHAVIIDVLLAVAIGLSVGFYMVRLLSRRRQAEKALLESEEKYRKVVNNAGEAIMVIQDGLAKFANPRAMELFGYTSHKLYSRRLVELVHPDDREIVDKLCLETLKGGEFSPAYHTHRIIGKGGDVRLTEITATKIIWEGKPAVLAFLADVTERKRMEEVLADEATRRSILIDQSRDGMVVLDGNGKVYEANQRFAEMLGYSPEEVCQLHMWDWDAKWTHQELLEMTRTVDEAGDNFETRHRRKDGTVYDVEISANGAMFAGQKLVFCVCRDITERKRAEEVVKQSEERYRTILEDVEKGYCEADLAGNITFVNDSMCRILGYANEEMIGTNYHSYAGEENAGQIYKDASDVYKTAKPAKWFSWEISAKSGETRFVEVAITPKLDTHGEVIGFRGIFNDVTEREATEQQVLMTSKLASIGELASGVAHELNNPLTSVIGYAQLLADSKDVPPEVKSDLNRIYQESQRATKIVQNLLSFARPRKPEKIYFDASELVQKTLDLRNYELKTSNIRVHTNLEPGLPEIKADYHQIQQVILNIVINAEQALTETKRRGKITVTTSVVEERVRISIADNGPGIPKENISRIFDPFFTTKEVGKGTGLGLSVCHGIVTAHGGNIYVESEKGKGTVFIIDLSAVAAEQQDVEVDVGVTVVESSPKYRRKASENILIVDDEPGIREILSRVFSGMGYRTDSAPDAESALAKLTKKNDYDLCIVDLKLTRISGKRLYEIMKKKHPSLAEKVMFITGDTVTPSTQSFLDSTGKPYLTKPFNPKAAAEFVEKILEGKGSSRGQLT